MPDQVHQGKGAHAKSAKLGHSPINGGDVGKSLFQNVHGFRIKRSGHTIHDETGAVFGDDPDFTPGFNAFHTAL